ncbi:hypothetical protein ACLMAJ_29730 [Nocardia sp. KC 131]|uniref:hypothetical protein n=1 Tax=Nocardia arseniciresistens TaxID=3392119 RepID=UPI00398EA909
MDTAGADSTATEGLTQINRPNRSARRRAESNDGELLNAEFSVEADGEAFSLIIESAGGKIVGSALPRNSDYVPLLEVLLARLRELDATIVAAEVISSNAAKLPVGERRLVHSPIAMSSISDVRQLRLDLTRTQGRVGLPPSSKKEGNGRKRVLLRITVANYGPEDADQLATDLSRSAVTLATEHLSIGETDGHAQVRIRREQSRLRRILCGSGETGICALCGHEFPTGLLVAAHIKKRRNCTPNERRDLSNVAMLACTFGCDALYEDGWVSVDHTGRILIANKAVATPAVRDRLASLAGIVCDAHKPSSEPYFAWHRATVFRSRP